VSSEIAAHCRYRPRPCYSFLTVIDVLERWEANGAFWKTVHVSEGLAIVDLCTCHGEPVDRLETDDAASIAYVRGRLEDESPGGR
jgi:hypothetical protein